MLNDWGCAALVDQPIKFSGSILNAPDYIIKEIEHKGIDKYIYKPQFKDDLHMVVKCLYSALHPVYRSIQRYSGYPSQENMEKLLEFWSAAMKNQYWVNLKQCADAGDYQKLSELINMI